jgi:uncharacterized protein
MQSTHTDYHPATTTGASKPGRALDLVSLSLLIIGGLNWGLVGLFDIDLVATLFGEGSLLSRVVYAVVGLAALYGVATAMRVAKRTA